MSNIVSFKGANLPSVASLSTALKEIKVPSSDGGIILKMDKTGHWVFGSDSTEVEDAAEWAVNPFSFVHGYIAWGVAEVLGEKMTGITQPLPELDEAPKGAKKGWESQIGFSVKCLNGEDKDLEMRYSTTSVGGKKAVKALALEIAAQVEKDATKPVAVIALGKDHYNHKEYGRIFTPVFEVIDWIDLDGEAAPALESKPEPEPEVKEEAPTRRRSAAPAPAPEPTGRRSRAAAPAPADLIQEEAPAPTTRRRRTGA